MQSIATNERREWKIPTFTSEQTVIVIIRNDIKLFKWPLHVLAAKHLRRLECLDSVPTTCWTGPKKKFTVIHISASCFKSEWNSILFDPKKNCKRKQKIKVYFNVGRAAEPVSDVQSNWRQWQSFRWKFLCYPTFDNWAHDANVLFKKMNQQSCFMADVKGWKVSQQFQKFFFHPNAKASRRGWCKATQITPDYTLS